MTNDYLIIAGTNKAGTTSLYEYLAAHPVVCGAFIKQTSFFFDKDYSKADLKVYYDYENPDHSFDDYFRDCTPDTTLKMEASPDYMYSTGTARRIREYLGKSNVKIIFILRDPVTRFESLFRFGKQSGDLAQDMSIKDFFDKQTDDENVRFWYNSLITGNYSEYIKPYFEHFVSEDIIVLYYEEMKEDPQSFMETLSAKININPKFYKDYSFVRHNKTYSIKSKFLAQSFLKIRNFFIEKTVKNETLYKLTKGVAKGTIIPLYRMMNFGSLKKEAPQEDVNYLLRKYYLSDRRKLEALLGQKTPWK